MRRSVLLLTLMATAIVLASGVALAKAITCPNRADGSCFGTKRADTITGTEDADEIYGGRGADRIFALGGNDRIEPGKGPDTSDGEDGNDRYVFAAGWGKDAIAADSSGRDSVRFLQVAAGLKIALDDQNPTIPRGASGGPKSKVTFAGNFIENAAGSRGPDDISGSSSNNRLEGDEGSDSLESGGGNDLLDGETGDDTLEGGADDDRYLGSEGEDLVDDASGTADALDLSDHASTSATFSPLDGSDADANYEDLSIDLGGGNTVLVKSYFDNSALRVLESGSGTGLIENISFSDQSFDFAALQGLMGLPERDPVVASADSATTNEDTPVAIDVLANDSGPNLSVKAATLGDPAHGMATLITGAGPDQGKVRYEPDADYNNTAQSPDTFTYEACDNLVPQLCDEGTVSVTVNPVNDKPSFTSQGDQTVAENSGQQTVSGWATFDPGPANESGQQVADYIVTDENDGPLNSSLFTQNGQPDVSNTGTLSYTPAQDATGSITVNVAVKDDGGTDNGGVDTSDPQTFTITVSRVNSKPVAQDGTATMDEDAAAIQIDFRPLVSDAETADADLTYTIVGNNPTPQQGTLIPTGTPGLYSFDSADNFNGTVEISYKVTDGGDPDNCGAPGPSCAAPLESDVKTVTITVNSLVDPPVISSGGTLAYTENDGPIPVDDGLSVTHPEGAQITGATVRITANYSSGEDLLAFTDNDAGDGITQSGGFDSGTGTLTLGGSGSDAEYQAALRAVTYENQSENPSTATRTVRFLATDANSATSAPATRDISVTSVDDAPVAVNDSATLLEDAAATNIPVLTNDTDVDGGPKTISSASDPANGTVTLTGGGSGLTYRPDANYCNDPPATNLDTFTYALNGGSTATVSMTVTCVNDAPVADDESFNGASRAVGNTSLVGNDPDDGAPDPNGPQKTISGDILAGDTDVDGPSPLAVQAETKSTNDGGSVTIQSDGDFTFHPEAGTSCTDHSDSFDYTVTDGNTPTAGTDTGTVTVEIQDCVWYVDGSAGSGGDGRSHSPFNSLASVNGAGGAGDADDASQKLFLYDGSYSGGLLLENNQTLFSQRHGLTVPDGGAGNVTLEPAVPAGPNTTITGGLTLANGNTIQGIHLGNATGSALSGASVGTATMNTQTSGAIDNQSGKAVDISNGTLSMAFTGVSSNNSPTDGIRLDNVAGAFNAAGGSIQNAAEQDIDISGNNSGDTVNFTYEGSITDDTGALVNVSGQSGGTKDFNGTITDGNDGDGAGISLTNNSGATVRFDGGLTLSTGSNAAFSATGGGTVVVSDPAGATDNTIATTTGTALNVANTTIGSDDLTFRSISANGAQNGIVLNNSGTSGGLTVAGGGDTSQGGDNSGGTIQNTTGDGISLVNTTSPSFNNLNLQTTTGHGINGTQVANFTFTNGKINGAGTASDHSCASFDDLEAFNVSGTFTFTNNQCTQTEANGVDVQTWGSTLSDVNISNNLFTDTGDVATPGSAVLLIGNASASAVGVVTKATLANNTITDFRAGAGFVLQANSSGANGVTYGTAGHATNVISVTGNLMDGGNGDIGNQPDRFVTGGINGRGQGNYDVSNNGTAANRIRNIDCIAIELQADGIVNMTSKVQNNFINPNSAVGCAGIAVGTDDPQNVGAGTHTTTISGNNVMGTDGPGIFPIVRDSGSTMTAKVLNNTVAAPITTNAARAGIRVDSGSAEGDTTLCLEISGNNTAGSTNTDTGTTSPGINLRKQGTDPTINTFGIEGMAATSSPGVENYVNGLNTSTSGTFGTGGTALLSATSGFTNCSAP